MDFGEYLDKQISDNNKKYREAKEKGKTLKAINILREIIFLEDMQKTYLEWEKEYGNNRI